jgi:hypothetical protein
VKIETPLFNAWRIRTRRSLAVHGIKAQLAEHLTKKYGRTSRSWQRYIAAILSGERLPNAEIVLAIDQWLVKEQQG